MPRTAQLRDRYGLALSTSSTAAVDHYIEGIDRRLSLNAGGEASLRASVEADPDFALAHAGLAFGQFYERKVDEARASVERARALAGGVTRRERQQVELVAAFVNGPPARAWKLVREQLAEFPRDAVALQVAIRLLSANGSVTRREELLDLLTELEPSYGDDWWFLGYYAFAHHEMDRFDEARQLAERSLARYPRNATASHPLAHVFYETSDHVGGAEFLGSWLKTYDSSGPFRCHLSWHLALFELNAGHEQRVLELYEQAISPAAAEQRTTLEDSASLLWRYQIYGCEPRPLPWAEICDYAGRVAPKPGMAFMDAHAALAYAAMGDEVALDRLTDGLRSLAAAGDGLVAEVMLPLVQAIRAFGQGAYGEYIQLVEPLTDQIVRIGGSHAQREVFEDTLLQAYLRTNRFEQAEVVLRRRLDQRSSARDLVWLKEAQTGSEPSI